MPNRTSSAPDASSLRSAPAERRQRVVDAFIDLVLDAGTPPTPDEVSARAGISQATFYRYFDSLHVLRHAAMARVLDRFPHLFGIAQIGSGTRRERIERLVASRVAMHEATHPLSLLLRTTTLADRGAADLVAMSRGVLADQVRLHFDEELSATTPASGDDIVATIATLTSVEGWEQMHHGYGRSAHQIRRAWASAIDRLLPSA